MFPPVVGWAHGEGVKPLPNFVRKIGDSMSVTNKSKILDFKFESNVTDVGVYQKKFLVFRENPQKKAGIVQARAALMGNQVPITRQDQLYIDAIATLSVCFSPVDNLGKEIDEPDWIDNIYDTEIIYALYREWMEYQTSFLKKKSDEPKTEGELNEAPKTT